jgi:hypothetical protein
MKSSFIYSFISMFVDLIKIKTIYNSLSNKKETPRYRNIKFLCYKIQVPESGVDVQIDNNT